MGSDDKKERELRAAGDAVVRIVSLLGSLRENQNAAGAIMANPIRPDRFPDSEPSKVKRQASIQSDLLGGLNLELGRVLSDLDRAVREATTAMDNVKRDLAGIIEKKERRLGNTTGSSLHSAVVRYGQGLISQCIQVAHLPNISMEHGPGELPPVEELIPDPIPKADPGEIKDRPDLLSRFPDWVTILDDPDAVQRIRIWTNLDFFGYGSGLEIPPDLDSIPERLEVELATALRNSEPQGDGPNDFYMTAGDVVDELNGSGLSCVTSTLNRWKKGRRTPRGWTRSKEALLDLLQVRIEGGRQRYSGSRIDELRQELLRIMDARRLRADRKKSAAYEKSRRRLGLDEEPRLR